MTNNDKDYYKILEVSPDSTLDEIKRAWAKLLQIWHPDVNNTEEANKKTQEINEAYFAIINKKKEQEEYDATSSSSYTSSKKTTANNDYKEIFEELRIFIILLLVFGASLVFVFYYDSFYEEIFNFIFELFDDLTGIIILDGILRLIVILILGCTFITIFITPIISGLFIIGLSLPLLIRGINNLIKIIIKKVLILKTSIFRKKNNNKIIKI